jgi:hypothetical protein
MTEGYASSRKPGSLPECQVFLFLGEGNYCLARDRILKHLDLELLLHQEGSGFFQPVSVVLGVRSQIRQLIKQTELDVLQHPLAHSVELVLHVSSLRFPSAAENWPVRIAYRPDGHCVL